ncbi:MAG TPA: hypothetical protein VFD66_00980 [Verrucomicrobiae bacterium]|nr:hypothetical protein [Verrucomicrobiae bacterium]
MNKALSIQAHAGRAGTDPSSQGLISQTLFAGRNAAVFTPANAIPHRTMRTLP